ncbi:DUF1679 domain-containing protein [archaeon]|nr:MAG: DUF1679 domain-containing protein [archaeon]
MEFTDDVHWIRSHLTFLSDAEREEANVAIEDFPGAGGMHALTKSVKVEVGDKVFKYVYKQVHHSPEALERSRSLGTSREAIFYNEFAPTATFSVPKVLCSYGNMKTGEKKVVLEDVGVTGIQSGYFFGPGSPLNWGKDLPAILARVPHEVSAKEVSLDAFREMAKMHKQYWNDSSLQELDWIRAGSWYKGEQEETWMASQNYGKGCWEKTKAKVASGECKVEWNSQLVTLVDSSISKISWADYQNQRKNKPFTLVHGDFHPANIMWVWSDDSRGRSTFVDWEVVGVGDGAQDLAQYTISHMHPSLRREIAKELVEAYYADLTSGENAVKDFSLDQCWADFVAGGIERWVWLLSILTDFCPDNMVQYFHDQVLAFMQDYGVTAESIGMPRV